MAIINKDKPPLSSLMGNGGANYNTADAATQKSIVDNETKLNTDPNFKLSELARTNQVRQERLNNGLDVTDQNNYLQRLGGSVPTEAQDLIRSTYDKNVASILQQHKSLRDTQLAGLAGQEDVINQNKVSGLNQNDVLANNNWRSLKESMANAGVNGGDSVTAQIGNQTAQQQGAVDINNNASNQLKTLMAQRAAINNNASADDLAAMQQLQGTRDTQLLSDLYKNKDYGISEAGLTGNYNGKRTLAGQTLDSNNIKDNAILTGYMPDGTPTNAKQQQDLQNKWTVAEQTGVIPDDLADFYGLPRGMQTQAAKTSAAQIAISQQNANTSASSAASSAQNAKDRLAWDKDPNNPDNLYKMSAIDKSKKDPNGVDMNAEVDGLTSSLRAGKLTPETALQQLEEDFSLGHYTKPQYDQLKSTITKLAPNYSKPPAELTPQQQSDIPSDKELDKMIPKGVPALDWKSWYKDPRGRASGVPFENWHLLFGPRLEAKR